MVSGVCISFTLLQRNSRLTFGDACQGRGGSQNRPASATTVLLCDLGYATPHPGPMSASGGMVTVAVSSDGEFTVC